MLPLAFGEAGRPVHPLLREALAAAAGRNAYAPVAGLPGLREAAAGYWTRRGLPTSAGAVVSGPGSKPLLFALLLAVGADVAVPQPSWVSYAAQAALAGARPHFVPVPAGRRRHLRPLRARPGRHHRPGSRKADRLGDRDPARQPHRQLAQPATVRALCEVAARHDLIIISDEIYRDLVYDTARPFLSPAKCAPERTVVTTTLSKRLALGGWRAGAARLPDGPAGRALCGRALGIASEIWSATAARSSTPRRGLHRAPGTCRTDRPQPVPARGGRPRRGGQVRRHRAGCPATAGRLLPLPQFRHLARPAGRLSRRDHRPRSRPPPAGPLQHGRPARQRVRRRQPRAADAGRHRAAVRGHRRPAGNWPSPPPARSPSPGSPPAWTGSKTSCPASPHATAPLAPHSHGPRHPARRLARLRRREPVAATR